MKFWRFITNIWNEGKLGKILHCGLRGWWKIFLWRGACRLCRWFYLWCETTDFVFFNLVFGWWGRGCCIELHWRPRFEIIGLNTLNRITRWREIWLSIRGKQSFVTERPSFVVIQANGLRGCLAILLGGIIHTFADCQINRGRGHFRWLGMQFESKRDIFFRGRFKIVTQIQTSFGQQFCFALQILVFYKEGRFIMIRILVYFRLVCLDSKNQNQRCSYGFQLVGQTLLLVKTLWGQGLVFAPFHNYDFKFLWGQLPPR